MDKIIFKKESDNLSKSLNPLCRYLIKKIKYRITRAILFVAFFILAIMLLSIPFGETAIDSIETLCRLCSVESETIATNHVLHFMLLVTLLVIIIISTFKAANLVLPRKGTQRNFNYVTKQLSSQDRRAPATSIKQLAERISGENAPQEIIAEVRNSIDKTVTPIKNFVLNDEKVLVVSGKWGSGKTTSTAIAINEASNSEAFVNTDYRFIYESAFKYVSGFSEFKKDILTALHKILSEQCFIAPNPIREILNNMSPSSTHIPINANNAVTTTDYIETLNRKYDRKSKNTNDIPFRIVIIIDDIDRLQSNEIIESLSFLSILRRLKFVKIIIPIDREAVIKQIDNAGINEPNLYIKKYLPEQSEVEIKSDFELFKNIFTKKVHKDFGESFSDEQVQSILELICVKVFSNRLWENMQNARLTSLNGWPHQNASFPQELTNKDDNNSEYLLKARDFLYNHLSNEDKLKVKHFTGATKEFEAVIYKLAYKGKREPNERGMNPLRVDEELYRSCYANWILEYAANNWELAGVTMRELEDIYNYFLVEIKKEGIDNSLKPHKIFVRTYNALFPRWPILDENWER